jgi:hypothetical protein
MKKFYSCYFFLSNFWSSKPWIRNWIRILIRIRIQEKYWIRIRTKSMRIHNPVKKYCIQYVAVACSVPGQESCEHHAGSDRLRFMLTYTPRCRHCCTTGPGFTSSPVRLQYIFPNSVLGIRIRRIRMFLGLPNPRCRDPAPELSITKQK